MPEIEAKIQIHAKDYQEQLGKLAATMVEKVFREGSSHIAGPSYVREDIATMLRYSASIYNLLNYLNADERRNGDCYWFVRYGVSAMSLIRSLIDCLYNVTAILENPAERGPAYHRSGLKRAVDELNEDYERYGAQEEWESYIVQRRVAVQNLARACGFTLDEVRQQQMWPTLGTYLRSRQPDGSLTELQQFLKTFTFLNWRQYSALSHGAFEAFIGNLGHMPVGAYYMNDFLPHEERLKLEESYHLFLSTHLGRAATVLLCLITELQAHCRFEGANINERIREVWNALMPLFEAKELYDGRYSAMMERRGVLPRQ